MQQHALLGGIEKRRMYASVLIAVTFFVLSNSWRFAQAAKIVPPPMRFRLFFSLYFVLVYVCIIYGYSKITSAWVRLFSLWLLYELVLYIVYRNEIVHDW